MKKTFVAPQLTPEDSILGLTLVSGEPGGGGGCYKSSCSVSSVSYS